MEEIKKIPRLHELFNKNNEDVQQKILYIFSDNHTAQIVHLVSISFKEISKKSQIIA